MNRYPSDRPGNDVTADSMEEARRKSFNCPFCNGHGLATVFHVRYDGRPVITFQDCAGREHRKAMRTVVYCSCAAGVKTLVLHQQKAKGIYQQTANLEDVLREQYPNWTVDDPTEELEDEKFAGMNVSDIIRNMANGMRIKKQQPNHPHV